ncbi:homoserine kinase [Oikeobacillus pervagus]|uniref:Homoserine kinase n=1 Tax=Oikeobacillus pervagus TaxID=1325931 RepID=A0AAJ1SXH4_9BACI|nr:homoserine kinase [Oikeobacillus pervagus]MDQ0214364.1 homoserine kinase [Oikeobacillus pervagus]
MIAQSFLKVPASTANLGPGFDSIGLALNRYLTLEITPAEEWCFEHLSPLLKALPTDQNHLIYQIAKKTADQYGKTLPELKIRMESEIPLARGLGSSAAAIAAGIEIADKYCGLSLSNKEKLQIGTKIEGHPDNIGASIYGGLVIGVLVDGKTEIVPIKDVDLDIVVLIPSYELKTEDARNVLPDSFERKQAVAASAISNTLIAALLSKQYSLAGTMMERDLLHEPYRIPLIKDFGKIRKVAKENGAFGTAISGAGPTVISFTEKGMGQRLANILQKSFPSLQVEFLKIDEQGIQWEEASSLQKMGLSEK